ncbi:glycosyltransferase [Candidatus Saccharibacteria bacterium]|nr:glycosyltransferase [Candidatus Saccharibacteria bacterium]
MKKPFFSVVIPTLNEEKFLPKLLRNLVDQYWSDFEVIHIDGHSDDQTVQEAAKFKTKLNIKTVTCKIRNVSVQRNLGGEHAVGEWIIFFDADTQIDPDFLLGIRYNIAKAERRGHEFGVFSSLITLNDFDAKKSKHRVSSNVVNSVLTASAKSDRPRLFGAMIGVSREAFTEIQFDPNSKFAEDMLFAEQIINKGYDYRLFRTPKFKFSMRRWDEQSLVATAAKAGLLQMQLIFGKDFSEKDYEMAGGTNYDHKD